MPGDVPGDERTESDGRQHDRAAAEPMVRRVSGMSSLARGPSASRPSTSALFRLASALALVAAGCSASASPDGLDGSADDASPADAAAFDLAAPTLRVLFVGNSYTSVNDLPTTVALLAESSSPRVHLEIGRHTVDGQTWEGHDADPALAEQIRQGWDHVVLQDQSEQPWWIGGVKAALLSLDAKVKASGGRSVLFMTWARKEDGENITEATRFAQDMYVNRYYERHGEAIGARVAPVGRAWERALRNPAITLHASDGSHPNLRGTYLAACVILATLTGQSPIGLGNGGLALEPAEVATLQAVARDTLMARVRPAEPLIGDWPIASRTAGNDLLASHALVPGDAVGPDGSAASATQFAPGRYAAIPYFTGLNVPRVTVSVHAFRSDWSQSTAFPQYLVGKWQGYEIYLDGVNLTASVHTLDDASPEPLRYPAAGLAAGWHHIALTYDGATYALWIDKARVASAMTSGSLLYPDGTVTGDGRFAGIALGGQPIANAESIFTGTTIYTFTGALAGLRLYGRALTANELEAP